MAVSSSLTNMDDDILIAIVFFLQPPDILRLAQVRSSLKIRMYNNSRLDLQVLACTRDHPRSLDTGSQNSCPFARIPLS